MYLPQCGFLQVNDYEYCLNDIKITLFDTPGLADRTGKEEEYLRKIRVKVTGPCDVFIFCTEMNATRFRDDDIKTLKTLTKAFGPRLWEHALVALTFANNVHPPKKAGVTEIGYFDGRIQMFKKAIKDVILEAGVSEKVMTNIPFVATGHLSELSLPGITDWIEVFWIETFKSLNKSAKLPFFVSNFERVKFSSSSAKQSQDPSRIHLTIESVKILLEAIKGFLPQSVQNMINFLIKWCGHTAALTAIMELIKDIWPKGTSKEDAKDNDEDAKEEENMADEYGVVEDMDQE